MSKVDIQNVRLRTIMDLSRPTKSDSEGLYWFGKDYHYRFFSIGLIGAVKGGKMIETYLLSILIVLIFGFLAGNIFIWTFLWHALVKLSNQLYDIQEKLQIMLER